jgi:hypothetical protein
LYVGRFFTRPESYDSLSQSDRSPVLPISRQDIVLRTHRIDRLCRCDWIVRTPSSLPVVLPRQPPFLVRTTYHSRPSTDGWARTDVASVAVGPARHTVPPFSGEVLCSPLVRHSGALLTGLVVRSRPPSGRRLLPGQRRLNVESDRRSRPDDRYSPTDGRRTPWLLRRPI